MGTASAPTGAANGRPAGWSGGVSGPSSPVYSGPVNPPYEAAIKFIGGDLYIQLLGASGPAGPWTLESGATEETVRARWGTGAVFPPLPDPNATETTGGTNNDTAGPASSGPDLTIPLDPRLIYNVGEDGSVVYSFGNAENIQAAMVDGFVVPDTLIGGGASGAQGGPVSMSNPNVTAEDAKKISPEHWGVPSLMNYNAYINLQAGGGKIGNKYLIDRENQPRWYDVTANAPKVAGDNFTQNVTSDITVTQLVEWCTRPGNEKFPYRYQDFVFLKWWKKIPLNYMITLRRYTFPVLDNVGSEDEAKGDIDVMKMTPAATAITFLGEDTGNKISSILGPISAGLKWKDIKADVHEVSFSGSKPSADGPSPGFAKVLGYLTGGPSAAKPSVGGGPPPDPYNNGPYSNKVLGPINVIDSTKARDKGLVFKHEIKLQFEYSARSIGGINAKAAMLDLLGNIMLLTYNEAPFWGGMNRFMPQAAQGGIPPFLGGAAGRNAWMKGDVDGFFNALGDQFSKAMDSVGDMFQKFFDDPVGGLKSIASGALSGAMLMNTTQGSGTMQGMHSLLTGDPVGEWHLTVGNPLNPMMMIGNLICTNVEISFNEELGPDDFPTELKAVITLDHGMPRDRAGIESMFNKGSGRIYSVPKGYENSFSSTNTSAVDSVTGGNKSGPNPWGEGGGRVANRNGNGMGGSGKGGYGTGRSGFYSKNPLLGDAKEIDNVKGYYTQSVIPRLKNTFNATYSAGVKFFN
jgi:hypothetical protein